MVANHLSQVRLESHFEEPQINDEFPDDALCVVEKLTWFINIVNYLATGDFPLEWNMEMNKYFLSRAKHYTCVILLLERHQKNFTEWILLANHVQGL